LTGCTIDGKLAVILMNLYRFIQKDGKGRVFQIMLKMTIRNIKKAEINMKA